MTTVKLIAAEMAMGIKRLANFSLIYFSFEWVEPLVVLIADS